MFITVNDIKYISPVNVGIRYSGSRSCSILVTMVKMTASLLRLYFLRQVTLDRGAGLHATPVLRNIQVTAQPRSALYSN